MRKAFYRRKLPHLQRDYRPHFITFCTYKKWALPESARQIVLDCSVHDHDRTMALYVSVVMPDHAHMIFTPLINRPAQEIYSLASIMDAIKGGSSHKINRALRRKGSVWQAESFHHVLRSSESLDAKIAYILANPVRAALVMKWEEYPWLWRRPVQIPILLAQHRKNRLGTVPSPQSKQGQGQPSWSCGDSRPRLSGRACSPLPSRFGISSFSPKYL